MALFIHLFIGFSSMVMVTIAYAKPTQKSLFATYALTAGTLASGTYLLMLSPSHLLEACFSGLAYMTVVGAGIAATHRKLAYQEL